MSNETFTPLLTTTDWAQEWKDRQVARRQADDATYWDKRAKSFGCKDATSPYIIKFLELAGIRPGEVVFDMGCGTGAITIPLAEQGHSVIAADFSAGMLGVMEDEIAKRGLLTVNPVQMSWEEDWSARGLTENHVDVAVASRSIATSDISASLAKLTAIARRRVCITLSVGPSPRLDDNALKAAGIAAEAGYDYLYAFNILASQGIYPEIAYIENERRDTFESFEEAWEYYEPMIETAAPYLGEEEKSLATEKLHAWLKDNLIDNPTAGKVDEKGDAEKAYALRIPRKSTWAFISWNK